jgi:hypothetical protein
MRQCQLPIPVSILLLNNLENTYIITIMNHILLTRDEFRESVFKRDGHKCVFCDQQAQDAHHILERRLWSDQGYYLNNGASVCGDHHIKCETTEISVEDVRIACKIDKPIIPDHLYSDQVYDKWGNPIMPNGTRLKGELFFDESVQKILKQGKVLDLFTNYVKYPRTWHLPWSPSPSKDDRVISSADVIKYFYGKRVIMSIKMDGENSSWYTDYNHARSVDSRNHPSRNLVKSIWATKCGDIPEGWRICGENLYAKHSIHYPDLESYFYGFSIWNDRNFCLSWNETKEYFELMCIVHVPVLYDGMFDEKIIRDIEKNMDFTKDEGYVIRLADGFSYGDFKKSVAKFVRKNHVTSSAHWMQGQVITPNLLKPNVCTQIQRR